jgi:hypothetical protein
MRMNTLQLGTMKRLVAHLLPAALALTAAAQTTDLALVIANMGRVSCASNAETILHPQLALSPARKTLLAGEQLTFRVSGETNPVTWFQVDNPSGASVSSLSITTLLYTAGSTSDCVDLIEGWDGLNKFGRARVNVISAGEVARAGKAIVIAGQSGPSDPVWPITAYLGDLAYNTLLYRGFSKANVQYLRAVGGKDVDGNGAQDDVDLLTSYANAAYTFTNWASNLDRLFVYLVDHGQDSGGNGYFRLNATDTLSAATLDAWLDQMQDTYSNEVTILIDFCYAGSFVDELAYPGPAKRTVIAACGTNQPTYFAAGGLVSFSDAFFSGVLLGLDVYSSFNQARNAMSAYQEAMLDDTGDGAATGADGAHAATQFLGSTLVAGKDIPQIGLVLGNQLLLRGTTATLWADDVVSLYPIERVWCLIVPPGHNPNPTNPVSDLVALDMPYDAQAGRYQAAYSGFSEEGTYKVMYYAKDVWDSVSLPRQSFVTQAGFDERVVLVAAGAVTNASWPTVDRLGRLAYHTFRTRWFEPGAVQYLSPVSPQELDGDGTNDVDGAPSLASLGAAITNWAMGSDKLTVYLIGDGGAGGALRLNATESLVPAELDYWLDVYQQSNAEACVVIDASFSGGFLPALRSDAEHPRVCVASCTGGQACNWGHEGLVSFSQHFLTEVYNGTDIWDAFKRVRNSVRKLSQRTQEPLLDDNGDGASTKTDGDFARGRYIGTAFMTGADAPGIGAVTPSGLLVGTNRLVLWAETVTDLDGISNVWCFVTPPTYTGTGDLARIALDWAPAAQRYEAVYSNFTQPGSYVLTFQAQDRGGEISAPVQSEILTADAYEPDDTPLLAAPFDPGVPQLHNRHATNDEDWVVFYATAGTDFEIEAEQLGTNGDLVLDVFTQRPDGTFTNLWRVDDYGAGEGEIESTAVDLAADPGLSPGLYYLRVSAAEPAQWGSGSDYELRIWVPVGGGQLVVVAVDRLGGSTPPPGAVAVIDGVTTQSFGTSNSLSLNLTAGAHTVNVPPVAGYLPEEDPRAAGQVTNPASLWGNPRQTSVSDSGMRFALFTFVPVVRAEGLVRDADTGGWVEGVRVEFLGRSGLFSNTLYDGYPYGATYKSNWWSGAAGQFPTNVWLPTTAWDLRLSHADYAARVWTGALPLLPRGTLTNLGVLALAPLDTNANGVADGWERRYFPQGGFAPTNDFDGDGSSDGREYFLGTDPTNALSVLAVEVPPEALTNGFRLRWPVVPGRTYELLTSGTLASDLWHSAAGPWTATGGQSQMSWQTNALPAATSRFFRINLVLP